MKKLFKLLCLATLIPAAAVAQTNFPTKPITLLVGSAPGGSNDTFARTIGRHMQDALGVSVVVENKPASGGVLANALVAKAPADGYTLVVLSSTFTTGAAVRDNLQYDAVKSFAPVSMLARGPLLITVGNNTPFKTLPELVSYARANPGKLNYGSSGVGSINQFATEILSDVAKIKMTHVPYKGMGPAVNDLMSGQIDMIIASAPSLLTHVNNDKIRGLAVTTAKRSEIAPKIPSLDEYGYGSGAVDLWWGVLAPAGTPDAVVQKLNTTINKIINSEEMKAFFLKQGASPVSMTPAEFGAYISNELARWKKVAAMANIQAE
ncbi:Bug family tripartite tricarboxylate transporter substrate binding protein [Zwartia panacis]|jgi:tripartite-type tricarboxylate transporter receptor subunit TctC|uniref:Bug family tripartite tricarboxylate transporter substrate binding protein n=1 Tax=Zwartia panacis TaxID=2683345 RepID=UPI0025B38183|nr:tripartite tricarboxylate transporter substrate binding protein [Zwartia panacis]MDN4018195.1 tripartite tricarboxylate transporter substrate binding protein [Zwartia panacis]